MRRRAAVLTVLAATAATVTAGAAVAVPAPPLTVLVSVTSGEQPVTDGSFGPSVSQDGTRVAFTSASDDLVATDTDEVADVFVRDVRAGTTHRVSTGLGGRDADGPSDSAWISPTGEVVAFVSRATNLVRGDTNGVSDVFVRDLPSGTTTRVSVGLAGVPADRAVSSPSLDSFGVRVAFQVRSGARSDVYVRDLARGTTTLVSAALDGGPGDGASAAPVISASGRYVAFLSQAADLVRPDANGHVADVFRRDLRDGRTVRVTKAVGGGAADGDALGTVAISTSGANVAFSSAADNLVPGDTNGEPDVFLRVLTEARTERVNVTTDGEQVGGFGSFHTVRIGLGDGASQVAFSSDDTGLAPEDTNGQPDVFLRDRRLGTTTLVSAGPDGLSRSGFSIDPAISADGRFVVFDSDAAGLTATDTNGGVTDVFRRRLR